MLSTQVGFGFPNDPNDPVGWNRNPLDFVGIWDTGATGTVISSTLRNNLRLPQAGYTEMSTANGVNKVEQCIASITLISGVHIPILTVCVIEDKFLNGASALIGMDVITQGDFSVSTHDRKTTMSFRIPSQGKIDYVKHSDTFNKREAELELRKSAPGLRGRRK